MIFQQIKPCFQLSSFIESYWYCESPTPIAFTDYILPTGTVGVVFNLGAASISTYIDNKTFNTSKVEVMGITTRQSQVAIAGNNKLLGIRFHPHAASLFFNFKSNEVINDVGDGGDLIGNDVNDLFDRLIGDHTSRLRYIEEFLLSKLNNKLTLKSSFQNLSAILNLLNEPKDITIRQLGSRLHLATRYIEKLFQEHIGISPKMLIRIKRFQRTLLAMREGNKTLASISYDHGYSDQSHFNREFKAFTGYSPIEFQKSSFPISSRLI